MTEEFYIGRRVAIRGGTLAPGRVVAIDAEGVTVERECPADEIGPLTKGAPRVRSRWHHDGDAFGRAGDMLCAWIEPWADEHDAVLAACGAEDSPQYAEERRERGGIDRPQAPATPTAAPAGWFLTLVLQGSRSLALGGLTKHLGRSSTEPTG